MIEFMQRSMRLREFDIMWIPGHLGLMNASIHEFYAGVADDPKRFLNNIVAYVLRGGRHPSLQPQQDNAASLVFVEQLQDFLNED